MRSTFALLLLLTLASAVGCGAQQFQPDAVSLAPVVVTSQAREALPNDYLRVSFVTAGTTVTSLGRPGALRAFATATPLYAPPLRLGELPAYSGLINNDANVLVAMRCQPKAPENVDALLATWPNVFLALQRDLPAPASCTPAPADVASQLACYARGFTDAPSSSAPMALAATFSYAGVLFDVQHTALAKWLKDSYGVFPAFSGLGYSVKDSYWLDSAPMTTHQMLVKSISSEYILKNVSLSAAGCRCIAVPPYAGRASDPLDPDFITKQGGDGLCAPVERLTLPVH